VETTEEDLVSTLYPHFGISSTIYLSDYGTLPLIPPLIRPPLRHEHSHSRSRRSFRPTLYSSLRSAQSPTSNPRLFSSRYCTNPPLALFAPLSALRQLVLSTSPSLSLYFTLSVNTPPTASSPLYSHQQGGNNRMLLANSEKRGRSSNQEQRASDSKQISRRIGWIQMQGRHRDCHRCRFSKVREGRRG